MLNLLIVPGLHGSEESHWQSQWQQHLPYTARVQQRDWETADLHAWSERVVATARGLNELVIVAHSFGVLASVRALPKLGNRVKALYLVAPAEPAKFGIKDLLPDSSLQLPGRLVASRNDPWLSLERAQQLASQWQLPLLDAGFAGHINVASGHGAWPQGLRWLEGLLLEQQRALHSSANHAPFHYQLAV